MQNQNYLAECRSHLTDLQIFIRSQNHGKTTLAKSGTFDGNSTKAFLCFDNLDIKNLNTKVFRLRFNVSGKLYSFGFADKNGNAGGARAAGEVNAHS